MSHIFRLYIDESGDHSYGKKILRKLQIILKDKTVDIPFDHYPELDKIDKRYLGLTGCIIDTEKYRTFFYPELEDLKQKHFPHNPDEPLILHRTDIINKRGSFWRLRDTQKEKDFNEDLLSFLEKMEYTIITIVIDKKAHVERYQEFAHHPYHYCLGVMLERYCGFLHFRNAKGDVMAESRGGREDTQLKEAYKSLYNSGTKFKPSEFFHSVLTSKEIKLKPKISNIAGLQIADILAHPSKQEIIIENKRSDEFKEELFGRKICEIIKHKYNRRFYNGRIDGYGKVFLK